MILPGCIKVAVGHVVKTHGVKGELSVALDDGFDGELLPGDALIVEINGLDVPFFVAAVRPRGSESLLLTLDDVADDTAASAFVGRTLYVYEEDGAQADNEFDDDDELTADRLVGYTILDGDTTVGVIDDIREVGPDCWYFVLRDSGKLIPIADEMIEELDHHARTVAMNLPAGLLDL